MGDSQLYNTATRQPDTLPEGELEQAITSGTHSYSADARINVIDPSSGDTSSVPATQLKDAISQGFKIETPKQGAIRQYVEQNKGLGGSVKVFLGKAADEAAMGVPGVIYDKTGDPLEVAKYEALKKEHDIASMAGGLTGFGASLTYGGPLFKGASEAGHAVSEAAAKALGAQLKAAGLSRLSEKAASSILGKAASKAVEMGVEGAVVSAPRALTEAALGDPEQAGESLLFGAGIGAAMGVPTGIIGGTLSKIAKRRADLGVREAELAANAAKQDAAVVAKDSDLAKDELAQVQTQIGPIFDVSHAASPIKEGVESQASNAAQLVDAAERQGVKIPKVFQSDDDLARKTAMDLYHGGQTAASKSWQAELNDTFEGMQDVASRGLGKVSPEQAAQPLSKATFGDEAAEMMKSRIQKMKDELSGRYQALDAQAQGLSIPEDARLKVVDAVEKNPLAGLESTKGIQSKAKAYANDVLSSDSITKLNATITSIKNDISQAARAGDNNLRSFLEPIKDAAVEARAAALDAGGLAGIRQPLDKDYAAFRDFLNDVAGEAKMGKRISPSQMLDKLETLPPEQIVDKVFNLKNSRGLGFFKENFPDAFEKLRQYKLYDIAGKAIKDDRYQIPNLLRQVKGLSPEAKEALFNPAQRQALEDLRVIQERVPANPNPSGTTYTAERLNFFKNPVAYASQNVADAAKVAALRSQMTYDGLLFLEQATKKAAEHIGRIPEVLDSLAKASKASPGSLKARVGTDIGPKAISALLAALGDDKDPPKTQAKAFERLQNRLQEPLNQPGRHLEKSGLLVNAIQQGGAPKAAESFTQKYQTALNYLDQTMPKALGPASLVSMRNYKPSDHEMAKFTRRVDAAMNPFRVIDDLKHGTLTREQVETLDAVYPRYMGIIRKKIVQDLAETPRDFPYAARLKLSLILGMDLDPSLSPASIQALQATFTGNPVQPGPDQAAQSQGMSKPAVGKMGFKSRTMTDSERLSDRRI